MNDFQNAMGAKATNKFFKGVGYGLLMVTPFWVVLFFALWLFSQSAGAVIDAADRDIDVSKMVPCGGGLYAFEVCPESSQFADNFYGIQSNSYSGLPESYNTTHNVSNVSQLTAALAAAGPGDRILLADGLYTLTSASGDYYYWPNTTDGTESEPIYLIAENKGQVTFSGSGRFRIDGDHAVVMGINFRKETRIHGEHVRIAHNIWNGTTSTLRYLGIFADHAEIDNNEITQVRGIIFWIPSQWNAGDASIKRPHIHHNWWHDIEDPSSGETTNIMLGYGYKPYPAGYDDDIGAVIENNLFERTYGDWELISIKSSSNVFRNNCMLDNGNSHITVRAGSKNAIYGNRGGGLSNTGIRLSGPSNIVAFNQFTKTASTNQHAVTLHTTGDWGTVSGVPTWAIYSYWSSDNSIVKQNLFGNFNQIIRIYTPAGTFVDDPSGVVIQNNEFIVAQTDYFDDDSGGHMNQADFEAQNTYGPNIVKVGTTGNITSCNQPVTHSMPSTSVDVGSGYPDIEGGLITAPSWW